MIGGTLSVFKSICRQNSEIEILNIKLLIKQFTFPLSLILLCYINLQYMHYSILIDKYSLTPFSYLESIIHAFIDICLLFFIPLLSNWKKDLFIFHSIYYHYNTGNCKCIL